jgi:hypothetical protein
VAQAADWRGAEAVAKGYLGEAFFMDDPALLDDPFPAQHRYRDDQPLYFHPVSDSGSPSATMTCRRCCATSG